MKFIFAVALQSCLFISSAAAESATKASTVGLALQWIMFPDARLEIRGLPWFKENTPELWRLPKSSKEKIPKRVWDRAVAPDGGRIYFASDTSRLSIRVEGEKKCFFDAYVYGEYAGSAQATTKDQTDLTLFENKKHALKQIVIYLPNNHQTRVIAVAVDAGAKIESPSAFAMKRPIVCYGSSVLQGSGAAHPAKTYPAILARRLNCDFVNLGFGGAGKAEPEVVGLVNSLDACCYIFDLGKSYGDQTVDPYARMIEAVRATHPDVPIFCVTPIYSTKEPDEPAYREKSERLRTLMRQAGNDRRKAGDKNTFVVEGLDLFNLADKEFFHDSQHPNDEGNELIAKRLATVVKKILPIATSR